MVTADDIRTRLDAIEERAARALKNPNGQQYDAAVLLASDLPAVVAALRDALAEVEGQTLVARQYERERDTARAEVGALTQAVEALHQRAPVHAICSARREGDGGPRVSRTTNGSDMWLCGDPIDYVCETCDGYDDWPCATVRALATTEAGEES